MFPLFEGVDKRKRRINLGGASAAASHDDILENAKAIRNERLLQRRREEAAITLQSFWRGHLLRNKVREEFRSRFDADPSGIEGMRCLVLLKDDEDRLGVWSERVASLGQVELASGPQQHSWLVLVCQLATRLLHSVSRNPHSQHASAHINVITGLLDPTVSQSRKVMVYLLHHNYYSLLKEAIENIHIEAKTTSPSLPLLVPLITVPFNLFPNDSEQYTTSFTGIAQYILTIPLLPNRLPLHSLTSFSARLPLHDTNLLQPSIDKLAAMGPHDRVHLLANLAALMPPRYKAFKTARPLETYLKLLTAIISGLPAHVFEVPASDGTQNSWSRGEDSDEETEPVAGPSSASQQPRIAVVVEVDAKTRARLRTLGSSKHVGALISASTPYPSTRLMLYAFFMALYSVWPTSRAEILSSVLASAGGGLLRELYRSYVRSSPLGREGDDSVQTLVDPTNGNAWLPLLFLADLYDQALLTMGDDEFFASRAYAGTASSTSIHRNPLTVDEVISFSRQLMNIAFTLYWNESMVSEGTAPGMPVSWEGVRDKMTKLLQAIHSRDSRRPFTPPNHWLCSSQIDMSSFIEAAVSEDQSLSSSGNTFSRRGRATNKRLLAHLSPRLGVLNNIPFAISFETRVEIFREFVKHDIIAFAGSTSRYERAHLSSRQRIVVRRGQVASDGFDKLGNTNLKGLIEIVFVDQFGNVEAGIDGGGVFKEFFTSLSKEVFDTNRGLWLATNQNELYPAPHSYAKEPHSLEWYRFIGRILGKALYEGILVDAAFAGFFLAKWLGKQTYLDDLASLDPELYNGLLFLKNYTGNPEELSLSFAVSEEDFGETKTINLIRNGSNTPVTKENRLQYIYLMCHYHLSKKIRPQSEAFFEGLSEMIDPKWIRMFNQQELQILIGGVNAPIDLDDLRRNTNYGGYKEDEPTIEAFWRVVNSLDHEQRRALLRFVTSCSRPPLLGFKELQPNFSIRRSSEDQDRLPSASTCVNLLKLPAYRDERVLKAKLLQAITSGAGFDLS